MIPSFIKLVQQIIKILFPPKLNPVGIWCKLVAHLINNQEVRFES